MSFGSGWTAANNWQGDYGAVGDLSAYTDYANAHTYPNLGQGTDWAIQRLNGLAQLAAASRPVITTEIGWEKTRDSLRPTSRSSPSTPSMDGIKDGDVKTYFYGLFDDGSGKFGLMNADGTPSPPARRSTTSRRCWPMPARPQRRSPPVRSATLGRHHGQRQRDW